jgi:predicted dehydrogenase
MTTRRTVLKGLAASVFSAPFVYRAHAVAPSETVYHASFGAGGMAGSDLNAIAASPHVKLVAVADVDLSKTKAVKEKFPNVKVYQDWRELLDKEKNLTSVNVSTPDHMHAPITMRAMQQGLHVYTQKPLTQTIYEARQLAKVAEEKKIVSQMGIQIHSHEAHRTVVATIQAGAIGKVKEVHSWSGKHWGDRNPRPSRMDKVPEGFNWDMWLGVAEERPFIAKYYHPGEWRKRLDFGTGTFGDMGCHLLDPVFSSLTLPYAKSAYSDGGATYPDSWGLDSHVKYTFPGTQYTTDEVVVHWYDGDLRPPVDVKKLVGGNVGGSGSIYIGTEGVLYSPYIGPLVLHPVEKFRDYKVPTQKGLNHWLQFVNACRGEDKTGASFSFAGPMTESVLLGCLATRFHKTKLEWDAKKLEVTNVKEANKYVRRTYRKGWEVEGL